MKKTLLSLAAVAALGVAAPALAQPVLAQPVLAQPVLVQSWGYRHAEPSTTAYVDSLDWRITNAAREGRISWDEARGLRYELRQVQPIAWRVQTGEANGWERERLQRVVGHIERATSGWGGHHRRYERWGGYGRGYDDRDGGDDWR